MKQLSFLAVFAMATSSFAGDFGAPGAPGATGFSYDFIDADWLFQEFDSDLDNGNGFSVAGSKGVGQNFFVNASYAQLDSQALSTGTDVDVDRAVIGGGAYFPIASGLDLTLQAGGVYSDADIPEEFDEWGYLVGIGFRYQAMDNLEIFGGANWVEALDDGNVEATVGGILQLIPNFGIRVGGRFTDDTNQLFVGGRINY